MIHAFLPCQCCHAKITVITPAYVCTFACGLAQTTVHQLTSDACTLAVMHLNSELIIAAKLHTFTCSLAQPAVNQLTGDASRLALAQQPWRWCLQQVVIHGAWGVD
jgi:hypothetical protein